MSIFHIPIDSINKETIESLINNVSESTHIDFKREYHINEEQKKELLADVVSFATTAGGDIIYGISEIEGMAQSIIPIKIPNIDQFKLSLSNTIRDCIEPRINFHIHDIHYEDKFIIILRIFKLFPGPPMLIYKNSSKFYRRSSAGKYPMNYLEIKNSFLLTSTVNDIFKKFRDNRVNHFLSAVERNNPSNPFMLFYLYPLNENNFDINSISEMEISNAIRPYEFGGGDFNYNIEGFQIYSHSEADGQNNLNQSQLFYNGAVEFYNDRLFRRRTDTNKILINIFHLENFVIKNFLKIFKFYVKQSIFPPYIVNLCFINVKNSRAITEDFHSIDSKTNYRDNLIFREFLIHPSSETPIDYLKPVLDDFWRAYGISKSSSFDHQGKFTRNVSFN